MNINSASSRGLYQQTDGIARLPAAAVVEEGSQIHKFNIKSYTDDISRPESLSV
jgi:hypothetical protein